MSHTPGPWSSPEDIGLKAGCPVELIICHEDGSEDGGRAICGVYRNQTIRDPDRRKADRRVYDEEDVANARLIAAAPDLLDVLKRLEQKGGLGLDVHEWIRAAIAKAEGKAMT